MSPKVTKIAIQEPSPSLKIPEAARTKPEMTLAKPTVTLLAKGPPPAAPLAKKPEPASLPFQAVVRVHKPLPAIAHPLGPLDVLICAFSIETKMNFPPRVKLIKIGTNLGTKKTASLRGGAKRCSGLPRTNRAPFKNPPGLRERSHSDGSMRLASTHIIS